MSEQRLRRLTPPAAGTHSYCGVPGLTASMAPPRRDPTGFDPRKMAASSGMPARDPWARAETWRYSGPFTRFNRFKGSFPGLGIAAVAFTAYCGFEYFFLKDDHHAGEGGSHSEEHH